jgi:hypothetical protein
LTRGLDKRGKIPYISRIPPIIYQGCKMSNPIVWVCNEAGHPTNKVLDLLPNAEIKPLTLGDVNPLRVDRLAYHLAQGIVNYGKPEDYLLISGYQMVNILAVHMWITYFRKVRLLQWNAKQKGYELTEKTQEEFETLLQKELER